MKPRAEKPHKPAAAKKRDQKPPAEKVEPKAEEKAPPDKADLKPPPQKPEPAKKSIPAPPLPEGVHYIWGTGRRKKAVARVRIRPGSGRILINKREMDTYFCQDKDRRSVTSPLEMVEMRTSWDVWVNVGGGGFSGQAGAVMLGLARALCKAVPRAEPALRDSGLMTRDARKVERKKYGRKGARKRFQFSKR
ncbi:MAG: 30S ribosomal protein S9 [Phycisphaerae bacterium]|nr:30S ribosomal protein S9 [Phycisphaerae bacterium]